MSFLLQRVSSGAFLKGSGVWTSKKEQAMGFSTLHNAIRFCVKERIGDVQVVELGEAGQIKGRLHPFGKKDGRAPSEGRSSQPK